MLVRCNINCKNNVTTTASLDPETNEAICDYCGEALEHISSYAKNAMKINGDIIRKAKGKAFIFKCLTCKKEMQAIDKDGNIVGVGCSHQDDCQFDISDYMKRAVSLYSAEDNDVEKDD